MAYSVPVFVPGEAIDIVIGLEAVDFPREYLEAIRDNPELRDEVKKIAEPYLPGKHRATTT